MGKIQNSEVDYVKVSEDMLTKIGCIKENTLLVSQLKEIQEFSLIPDYSENKIWYIRKQTWNQVLEGLILEDPFLYFFSPKDFRIAKDPQLNSWMSVDGLLGNILRNGTGVKNLLAEMRMAKWLKESNTKG